MAWRAALLLVLTLLAGCADGDDSESKADRLPTIPDWRGPADMDCGSCFEPSLASDGKFLYLTTHTVPTLYRGTNGTWEALAGPVVPDVPTTFLGGVADVTVQVDMTGRLWWSSLARGNTLDSQVHVARSDDQGASWTVNQLLAWGPSDLPQGGAADRQWVAADGEDVWVACTCPAGALPQVRHSVDGGRIFGPPVEVLAPGRLGPIGNLVVGPGRTLVMPFLSTPFASPVSPVGPALASLEIAMSQDLGTTWERRTVWAVEEGIAAGGAFINRFPLALGDEQGFALAWTTKDGRIWSATSHDAVSWETASWLGPEAAGNVHPTPLRVNSGIGLAWWSTEQSLFFSTSAEHSRLASNATGTAASSGPGDFVAAVEHRGRIFIAWPDSGVRLASLANP